MQMCAHFRRRLRVKWSAHGLICVCTIHGPGDHFKCKIFRKLQLNGFSMVTTESRSRKNVQEFFCCMYEFPRFWSINSDRNRDGIADFGYSFKRIFRGKSFCLDFIPDFMWHLLPRFQSRRSINLEKSGQIGNMEHDYRPESPSSSKFKMVGRPYLRVGTWWNPCSFIQGDSY